MTYSVMDIARYVINYSIDIEKPISNLKLQKLLYYIQAACLIENDQPCFNELFTNWRHGPVQEDVYHVYKKYLGRDIWEKQESYREVVFGLDSIMEIVEKKFSKEIILEKDRDLIEKVINSYKDISAWSLVEKTHTEDPWIKTDRNDIIPVPLIKSYFIKHRSKIYGI